MLADVIEVRHMGDYSVYIVFEDGLYGIVDLTDCAQDNGIFAPLADVAFFSQCRVNRKTGTIDWPNGADLAPEFLYDRLKQQHKNTAQEVH